MMLCTQKHNKSQNRSVHEGTVDDCQISVPFFFKASAVSVHYFTIDITVLVGEALQSHGWYLALVATKMRVEKCLPQTPVKPLEEDNSKPILIS